MGATTSRYASFYVCVGRKMLCCKWKTQQLSLQTLDKHSTLNKMCFVAIDVIYLRDQTWLCVYSWCQTPEGVVSPRGETTPAGVWHQQYTHNHVRSRLQHDATIFSTATNSMLIKSNLKVESRTTAVSVAMSPRYLGGKHRSRPHPRSQKCAW